MVAGIVYGMASYISTKLKSPMGGGQHLAAIAFMLDKHLWTIEQRFPKDTKPVRSNETHDEIIIDPAVNARYKSLWLNGWRQCICIFGPSIASKHGALHGR